MPIHVRAAEGDYASCVLCPGDPRRAVYIAETFFDPGARVVNEERGMLGFTGTFAGAPISVQSTGMGCPSSGIVFEELVMLGATRLIRVGTCGGFAGSVSLRVRMALHSGMATKRDASNYAGPVVIRCARLRACGHGAQILVSDATAALARDQLAQGVSLASLGCIA